MDNQVTVEISARHVHLSQADLETLFGKGYALTVKKMLSQPGQYASNERGTHAPPHRQRSGYGRWQRESPR